MGTARTEEFRKNAVRIALTCGPTRKHVADDPLPGRVFSKEMPREGGCGHVDAEQKRITAHRDTDAVSKEDLSLAGEYDRLRREIRLLEEEYPSWSSEIFSSFLMIAQ